MHKPKIKEDIDKCALLKRREKNLEKKSQISMRNGIDGKNNTVTNGNNAHTIYICNLEEQTKTDLLVEKITSPE